MFILLVLLFCFYVAIFFLDLHYERTEEPTKKEIIKSLKWPWRLFIMIVKMIIEIFNESIVPIPFILLNKDYKQTSFYFRLKEFSGDWC